MSLASRLFGSHADRQDPDDVAVPLRLDDALEMVWTDRRRWLLREISQRGDGAGVQLTDLARDRASIEMGRPPETLDSYDTKSVYVSFYQTHIPRLADAGLVDYDGGGGVICANDATFEFVRFIDVLEPMTEDGHE